MSVFSNFLRLFNSSPTNKHSPAANPGNNKLRQLQIDLNYVAKQKAGSLNLPESKFHHSLELFEIMHANQVSKAEFADLLAKHHLKQDAIISEIEQLQAKHEQTLLETTTRFSAATDVFLLLDLVCDIYIGTSSSEMRQELTTFFAKNYGMFKKAHQELTEKGFVSLEANEKLHDYFEAFWPPERINKEFANQNNQLSQSESARILSRLVLKTYAIKQCYHLNPKRDWHDSMFYWPVLVKKTLNHAQQPLMVINGLIATSNLLGAQALPFMMQNAMWAGTELGVPDAVGYIFGETILNICKSGLNFVDLSVLTPFSHFSTSIAHYYFPLSFLAGNAPGYYDPFYREWRLSILNSHHTEIDHIAAFIERLDDDVLSDIKLATKHVNRAIVLLTKIQNRQPIADIAAELEAEAPSTEKMQKWIDFERHRAAVRNGSALRGTTQASTA